MRLVAITNSRTGYSMPVILCLNETKPTVRTQVNSEKVECDQFLVLGRKEGEQRKRTYNVLAEISSNPSNLLCDSSDENSISVNAYQLTRQAA